MSSPAQPHPHTGSGASPPQALFPLPDTSPCVGHHQAGRRAVGRMEGRAPRRQMDLSASGGGKEGKPMLNRVQKGVEPTPVTCREGRAQGTPPPCMQEHSAAAIPWGGPRPDPGGCRAAGGQDIPKATSWAGHSHHVPCRSRPRCGPLTRYTLAGMCMEYRASSSTSWRHTKGYGPAGTAPSALWGWGDCCTPKPSHPAQHTHAGAEGLQPGHQLLHGLPEGFQRRARLVHGEGLAVPAVWGGRARGVPVLWPLAGGRGWMCRTSLLPDLRVLCLQLVDLQPGEGGRHQQGGEGMLRRGIPLAPHPPRAAAGAAHRSGCCSPSSAAAPWPQRLPEPSSPPGTPAA